MLVPLPFTKSKITLMGISSYGLFIFRASVWCSLKKRLRTGPLGCPQKSRIGNKILILFSNIFVRTKDFLKEWRMDDTCCLFGCCFIIHGIWITHLLVYNLCALYLPQRMTILQARIEVAVTYRQGNMLLVLLHIAFWCKTVDSKQLIRSFTTGVSVCFWGF